MYSDSLLVKAALSLSRWVGSRCTEELHLLRQYKMRLYFFPQSSWWWSSHTTVSIRCFGDWVIVDWGGFMLCGCMKVVTTSQKILKATLNEIEVMFLTLKNDNSQCVWCWTIKTDMLEDEKYQLHESMVKAWGG